jgi:hypothetical protein
MVRRSFLTIKLAPDDYDGILQADLGRIKATAWSIQSIFAVAG